MRPNGRVLARALVAALLVATATVPARSQDRPAGDAAAVSDQDLDRRLRFIEDRLRARQTHGQTAAAVQFRLQPRLLADGGGLMVTWLW